MSTLIEQSTYSVYTDPAEVKLHVDGSSDKCSKGEDIDFLFTGFAIFGQVACMYTHTHTHTH